MNGPVEIPRQTVRTAVRIEGVGLFTGSGAGATIEPSDSGGIVFVRAGRSIPATIGHLSSEPAHPAFAQMPPRNTSVGAEGGVVHTVEHVLAALAGLGITDALVRMDGDELPIGDGSASLFTDPIVDAGVRTIGETTIEPVTVREPIRIESGSASITIEPSEHALYVYCLDYGDGSPIPSGDAVWDGTPGQFAQQIAPARTFCLQAEAEAMHGAGLFEHLTPRDMLVFGPDGPIDNTLRFPDEPARHKLLDLIGDLSLVGRPLRARVIAERSGHALNHEAARRVLALAGA